MIETVMEEIKLAEGKSLQMRTDADNYAAAKAKASEEESARIFAEYEERAKRLKKESKQRTAKKVEEQYNGVLSTAAADADALYGGLGKKIDELSDEVAGKILNGDC